jgi:hypothetical protein
MKWFWSPATLWKIRPATTVNTARAMAAMRVLYPTTSNRPPTTSTSTAPMNASCGNGRPAEAM